ncbi:hypothetical protein DSO57_1025220 [Entomophthora muscae]|uniref:Uncharacterized protein n=1 Tax=Entomophthora muscae TaxID=34485 RepID=A0ACC2S452_9FUNG|nr:hypothetical protein DSO57_1025220 [Entomophthora muscae]
MGSKSKNKSQGRQKRIPTSLLPSEKSLLIQEDITNQTGQPGALSEDELATVQAESDEVLAPMQDPSPIHDTFQSNEDLLKNIQLDHRTVWNRYASSAGTRSNLSASPPCQDDASRPRDVQREKERSGAPAGTPALSKSELEALEGRGISPSNLDIWIKLQFDFNQVNHWFTSGLSPNDAQK